MISLLSVEDCAGILGNSGWEGCAYQYSIISCEFSVISCQKNSSQRSAVGGQELSEAGFSGFIGFIGLEAASCQNRGLSRIPQMPRIRGTCDESHYYEQAE